MRYDAFISYRHSELDMYVAKSLHKGLETFKVPRMAASVDWGQYVYVWNLENGSLVLVTKQGIISQCGRMTCMMCM